MLCFGRNENDTEMGSIVKKFLLFTLGMFLTFSAYNFTWNLQSSINIEDGLGTLSLSCTYVTSIFFGLISTPLILQRFGPKTCLILSEVGFMTFIIANSYPTYYTMIPAAVFTGFAEATVWPCVMLLNVYFGSEYWKSKNREDLSQEHFINLFSGYYFGFQHFSQIFGSLVGLLIFNIFGEKPTETVTANYNVTDSAVISWPNATIASPVVYLQFCGSRDCQDSAQIDKTIRNYTPTNKIKLIVLVACFVLMCLGAQILHGCVLPDIKPQSINQAMKHKRRSKKKTDQQVKKCDLESKAASTQDSARYNLKLPGNYKDDSETDNQTTTGCCTVTLRTLGQVGRQLLRPKQLLILPITLHEGLLVGFIFSDLPRAYVSCVNGFAKISLFVCLYGVGHILASFIVGRTAKRVGRVVVFVTVVCLDLVNLLFCLLWRPSLETSWMVYISYLVFGLSDGTWQPSISVMYIDYFPDQRFVAGAVWISTHCLGIAIQYVWSTALCVYVKIYIMFAILITGFAMFCFAERIHRRNTKLQINEVRNRTQLHSPTSGPIRETVIQNKR